MVKCACFPVVLLLATLFVASGSTRSVDAEVVFANVSGATFFDSVTLTRVGVERGGDVIGYDESELIKGTVTAINIPRATTIISADGLPVSGAANGFLNDPVLNRGMVDPGQGDGTFVAGDEFTEYTFDSPVTNDAGNDLLLSFITFDLVSFQTSPGPYWLSVDGGTPVQINRDADLDLGGVASIPQFTYLNGLTSPSDFTASVPVPSGGLGNANATPRPSLQTVDLSELGIGDGDSVSVLRIWDDNASNGNSIHPTFIAGLPTVTAVPEPSCILASAVVLGTFLTRRKRS